MISGQIPRNRAAGADREAGGVEVVGSSIFLRRVDHGHAGADRGRTAANRDIACERGGKICDGSSG